MIRKKTTKEILAESLKELGKQKNIEKITIREITDNCGYSPATFYRHFKDKYDLILWDYVRYLEENILRIGIEGYTFKQAFLRSAYYHYEHRDYLANLIKNTSGLYSFETYMSRANYQYIKYVIQRKVKEIDKLTDHCLWVYCYGNVKYNSEWILGNIEATPEEMAEVYEQSIPEYLRQNFTDLI